MGGRRVLRTRPRFCGYAIGFFSCFLFFKHVFAKMPNTLPSNTIRVQWNLIKPFILSLKNSPGPGFLKTDPFNLFKKKTKHFFNRNRLTPSEIEIADIKHCFERKGLRIFYLHFVLIVSSKTKNLRLKLIKFIICDCYIFLAFLYG